MAEQAEQARLPDCPEEGATGAVGLPLPFPLSPGGPPRQGQQMPLLPPHWPISEKALEYLCLSCPTLQARQRKTENFPFWLWPHFSLLFCCSHDFLP